MDKPTISLSDRYDLEKSRVLLNGTQALVRLMLMQKLRDKQAGLNTAGYCTGYRGSPLGAVDMQMERAKSVLDKSDITFQPGMNEDLAATGIWGSQQAELRGEGKYDGVFGLWYGKGPGVDRSGDVMRHANMAGTSPNGGVLMAMGDDHTGESSTTLHQSDWAMIDAYMPIVSPAGVQEILDYGLYGWALSRFAGVWTGLKVMKDTIEVTSVVDGRPDRMKFVTPEFDMPDGGLNIRLQDTPVAQEARMIDYKRVAAEAFARANRIDKVVWGKPNAKIGFVAAGKNWLDLVHALDLLGLDQVSAERLGITTYKIAQVWPMDMTSFREWADGLDLIVVVEEKRKLIEVQVKEAIFDDLRGRRVYGWHNNRGEELFPTRMAIDPILVAEKIGMILIEEGRETDAIKAGMQMLSEVQTSDNAEEIAARLPYFCSGCPHNSSTKVPDGSRAYAGIGCHYMVQWMDRSTLGFTQMGGEGANWVGEAPFSTTGHIFQNIGDGTYNHSGIMAIRSAVAAGTTMTYKILFNDAVAMTGGQNNEGGLDAAQIAREIKAMGVDHIAIVYDEKEDIDFAAFPNGLDKFPRDQLNTVQEKYRKIKGVSVIIYVQTCAAEKRRRRKRGLFPDPDKRVFINPDICEGCGDCGVQSNCVSIVPLETDLGRKRMIDQSSCNKDFSCVDGFCPSFVTLNGAKPKKSATTSVDIPDLPVPKLPAINGTYNVVVTGIGGTGVVTIGAILSMAAHIDGKGSSMMEMSGLAQKGGAVHIHLRFANAPEDIAAIRVALGEADAVIGGDLVTTAGAKTIGLMKSGRTGAVVNNHEIITGEFTKNTEFKLPTDRLMLQLEARLSGNLQDFNASELARALLGDSIFSNMMMLGAAWQRGLVPIDQSAILTAIELNGAAVDGNKRAFEIGRWAIECPKEAAKVLMPKAAPELKTLDEIIALRADQLVQYQNVALRDKYLALVGQAKDDRLKEAVAKGYHKLLAYKDEYEVARLMLETEAKAKESFDGAFTMQFHLSPAFFSGTDANGRPKKRKFGAWMMSLFKILAKMKAVRGKWYDPFSHIGERKQERALIAEYERDMQAVLPKITPDNLDIAIRIAELPLVIKGFGPVKQENALMAGEIRKDLIEQFHAPNEPQSVAAE